MLKDIVEARHLGAHRLYLRFEDGAAGELDFSGRLQFHGVFARLKNVSEFSKVRVNPESGTIEWPGGIDLDPDVLYAAVTGTPIELACTARVGSRGKRGCAQQAAAADRELG